MASPLISPNENLTAWPKMANLWTNNYIIGNANMLNELMTLNSSLSKKNWIDAHCKNFPLFFPTYPLLDVPASIRVGMRCHINRYNPNQKLSVKEVTYSPTISTKRIQYIWVETPNFIILESFWKDILFLHFKVMSDSNAALFIIVRN